MDLTIKEDIILHSKIHFAAEKVSNAPMGQIIKINDTPTG